jgi:hypothetical protein
LYDCKAIKLTRLLPNDSTVMIGFKIQTFSKQS